MDNLNNDYDKQTYDAEDGINVDVKINPEFYIHKAIVSAIDVLKKDNIGDNILPFVIMIENAENAAINSKIVSPEEYKTEINKFKDTEEYKAITNEKVRMARLANYKYGLIIKAVSDSRTSTEPMKL